MQCGNYEFNIGDEVITTFGEKGKIVDFCNCIECRKRGFNEPIWATDDGEEQYITKTAVLLGFKEFYKIGKYTFNNFDKDTLLSYIQHYDSNLNQLKKQLEVIESCEREE